MLPFGGVAGCSAWSERTARRTGLDHFFPVGAATLSHPAHAGGHALQSPPSAAKFIYNTSVMDPAEQWKILTTAIILGGHVRVAGDDPFVAAREYAKANAELVKIAHFTRARSRSRDSG
jgi:hypothetical protein